MLTKKIVIGIIGIGTEDGRLNAIAEEAGSLIAQKGYALVNGGLGGVMRASARGAKAAGGVTVGILPGADPSEANPFIDIPVATGLGEVRNALIVRASSVLIAIGGGYGTLSEVALALKTGKPVVGIETWDVSAEIIKADSAKAAVKSAIEAIGDA